jgi:GR25 family glycosyltransferase involved in LPS biosynthesis
MLAIYTINLDHRDDRWEQSCANYQAHGLEPRAVQRWSACAEPGYGSLGCAKSHVAVLADFLTRKSHPFALVLEDDFDFVRPFADVVTGYNQLVQQRQEWDMLLMMGTQVVAGPAGDGGLARVVEAQSTAGYLVSRRYAPRLLGCFAKVVPQMEALAAPALRTFAVTRLSIDQVWKPLQREDRWFIFNPSMGRQRPGFSDVEQRNVDYDGLTYGLEAPAPTSAPA